MSVIMYVCFFIAPITDMLSPENAPETRNECDSMESPGFAAEGTSITSTLLFSGVTFLPLDCISKLFAAKESVSRRYLEVAPSSRQQSLPHFTVALSSP